MKDVTLKYFDSSLPIYIETDTWKKGIGVVMLQPDISVENTSCTEVLNNLNLSFTQVKLSHRLNQITATLNMKCWG